MVVDDVVGISAIPSLTIKSSLFRDSIMIYSIISREICYCHRIVHPVHSLFAGLMGSIFYAIRPAEELLNEGNRELNAE